VKDHYNENYETVKEEIEDIRKWADLHVHELAILLNLIYRFNTIPIEIPISFFRETEKSILQLKWKCKRPNIAIALLNKMSNAGGTTVSHFKLYYRATVTKAAWH
jgi:hypothetical protein